MELLHSWPRFDTGVRDDDDLMTNRLPWGEVEQLPMGTFSQQEVEQLEHKECCICLESYQAGDLYRRLPCLHAFHKGCIDTWFLVGTIHPGMGHSHEVKSQWLDSIPFSGWILVPSLSPPSHPFPTRMSQ